MAILRVKVLFIFFSPFYKSENAVETDTPRQSNSITRGSTPHTCDSPRHILPGTNLSPTETEAQLSAANPFSGTFPRSPPDTDVFRASTLYWCIISWTYVLVKKIFSAFYSFIMVFLQKRVLLHVFPNATMAERFLPPLSLFSMQKGYAQHEAHTQHPGYLPGGQQL